MWQVRATNSCSPDFTHGVDGNITNNPMFIDAANGDFRLRTGSACIDSGLARPHASTDLDGISRPQDGNGDYLEEWDMGAYEALRPMDGMMLLVR